MIGTENMDQTWPCNSTRRRAIANVARMRGAVVSEGFKTRLESAARPPGRSSATRRRSTGIDSPGATAWWCHARSPQGDLTFGGMVWPNFRSRSDTPKGSSALPASARGARDGHVWPTLARAGPRSYRPEAGAVFRETRRRSRLRHHIAYGNPAAPCLLRSILSPRNRTTTSNCFQTSSIPTEAAAVTIEHVCSFTHRCCCGPWSNRKPVAAAGDVPAGSRACSGMKQSSEGASTALRASQQVARRTGARKWNT
jgi:hypothetical protein